MEYISLSCYIYTVYVEIEKVIIISFPDTSASLRQRAVPFVLRSEYSTAAE